LIEKCDFIRHCVKRRRRSRERGGGEEEKQTINSFRDQRFLDVVVLTRGTGYKYSDL
jgi:hypothetical protein